MTKKSDTSENNEAMQYEPLLCSVNPQCLNCYHFWNTGKEYQKGKCTEPKSRYHKNGVNYSDVCDYFEAV